MCTLGEYSWIQPQRKHGATTNAASRACLADVSLNGSVLLVALVALLYKMELTHSRVLESCRHTSDVSSAKSSLLQVRW